MDGTGGEGGLLGGAELPPLAGGTAAGSGDFPEVNRITGGLHTRGEAARVLDRGRGRQDAVDKPEHFRVEAGAVAEDNDARRQGFE